MKKVLLIILSGLLIFPSNLVSATGVSTDKSRAKILSQSIEKQTGVSDIIKSNLNEDIYTDNTSIYLPNNGTDNVKISDLENKKDSFEIILPKEAKNSTPKTSANGTIVYNNEVNSNANIALQPTNDGIRSLVIINNLSASKEYTFGFNLPKGSRLITAKEYLGAEYDTKEVYVVNEDNIITSIISPPWAKDANGVKVPTYYRVEGNKLIQIVEFTKKNAFPIVADPSAWKVTKCITSITLILASVALPTLKIVKIKKYIKELGGIKMTVMLLMGTANAKEKVATIGALAAEISGITDIHDNCF
ncbi:hypothetical protein [Clostridium estertheticum]|uniref:hypothetical protein n=1 Tax=Clostridium estertheticum TaxID=238834 RepID=UPI001C0C3759|nr:hypothetical protein [Clostridium estertheticum]MBU3076062.1 hypothetical protein [Clostridium estertheticum]MBU3166213.1 hypothetical protein [Clostridium estertheticum]